MSKFVSTDRIYQALHAAGLINVEPSNVRRVVIDIEHGNVAKVYLETFADSGLIDFALAGGFTRIRTIEQADESNRTEDTMSETTITTETTVPDPPQPPEPQPEPEPDGDDE